MIDKVTAPRGEAKAPRVHLRFSDGQPSSTQEGMDRIDKRNRIDRIDRMDKRGRVDRMNILDRIDKREE